MAARVVELLQDLATFIGTPGRYSNSFNIVLGYPAVERMERTATTNCFIYPGMSSRSRGTRKHFVVTYSGVIHLVNFLDTGTLDELNTALALAEEIEESLADEQMAGMHLMAYGTEDNPEELFDTDIAEQRNYVQIPKRAEYQEWR